MKDLVRVAVVFQVIVAFFSIIGYVFPAEEQVRGDINYNIINPVSVSFLELQAPEVYINHSFWLRANITVLADYSANSFNATISLPSTLSLPNNDINHSNPAVSANQQYQTNWTVNATVGVAGNYTINVSTLVSGFTSQNNISVKVNSLPQNFSEGSVIFNISSYNTSDSAVAYVTLRDLNSNYINIMGICNISISYPNGSVFVQNRSMDYLTGSYGRYYYNFVVPNATGNYTAGANCSLPTLSNSTVFFVSTTNQPPYFYNIFVLTSSYIHRSDNNPTPTQVVNFWVFVNDSENDPLSVTFFYSSDNKQSWSSKQMIYDPTDNTWNTKLDGYPPQTIVFYYVNVSDAIVNRYVRTPTSSYDFLIWDYPPSTGGGGGGGGGLIAFPVLRELGKGEGKISIEIYPLNKSIEKSSVEFGVITIKNTGNGTLHDLFVLIEGVDLDWYSITPERTDIEPNETANFIVKFTVPSDAREKTYTINIRAEADEDVEVIRSFISVIPRSEDRLISIVDIDVSDLRVNMLGAVKIFAFNEDLKGKNLTLALNVPAGWIIDSREQIKSIEANTTGIFVFRVVPNESGTFVLTLNGFYENNTLAKDIYVNVGKISVPAILQEEVFRLMVVLIIVLLFIILVLAMTYMEDRRIRKEIRETRERLERKRKKLDEQLAMIEENYKKREAEKVAAEAVKEIRKRQARIKDKKLRELKRGRIRKDVDKERVSKTGDIKTEADKEINSGIKKEHTAEYIKPEVGTEISHTAGEESVEYKADEPTASEQGESKKEEIKVNKSRASEKRKYYRKSRKSNP